jgi:thiamine-phosphate pyrophosphorylase
MLDMGLPTLHIRKPNLSTEGLKKYLDNFSPEHLKKIVIHSHHTLMWDYNLKGIHLTKTHRKRQFKSWFVQQLIKVKRGDFSLSTSCSSLSSMALTYNDFEYIMLTPVFTQTQEHRPTYSKGTLDVILQKYPGKIVARGGAKLESIEEAHKTGFVGLVFHNYIWKAEDPIVQLKLVMDRFKELGLIAE